MEKNSWSEWRQYSENENKRTEEERFRREETQNILIKQK
jgi:hypothetical protein